ncbi:unnamed protein product [Linum trigynum]|uniref:Uncharacterized protein n=1 Tax=Linum trigynum TaxID=586398 RepID=A0AAV2EE15_9ROSI
MDEDRTRCEVSRKPHGQSGASHGRAGEQDGRVTFAKATHGQPMKFTQPCKVQLWPCDICRGQTRADWISHTAVQPRPCEKAEVRT